MAKDPAILWYYKDYLTGTEEMTFEEQGAYMRLLCKQADIGHLSMDMVRKILKTDFDRLWPTIQHKFKIDEKGWVFNERINIEKEKRNAFVERQKENGKKGGRPSKSKKTKKINSSENEAGPKSKPNPFKNQNPNKSMRVVNANTNVDANSDVIENEKEGAGEKTKRRSRPIAAGYHSEAPSAPEVTLPFTSDEFRVSWQHWKDYRKGEFKTSYKTPQSEQAALNHLCKISSGRQDTAIAIIDQSMGNNWKGFFELKTQTNAKSSADPNSLRQRVNDAFAKRYPDR